MQILEPIITYFPGLQNAAPEDRSPPFMEYHNPTLRVLRIMELIDANSGGLSLSEISNLLALPKGTISPILKTLAATNYIVADGSLYKIGPHTFELGLSYASGQNALSIIRSEMRSIVSKVDEVCQMGVLVGPDVHYLLKEEGHAIISIISEVGHHLPAHVTGLGKALLSGMPDETVRQLYEGYRFFPYTPNSIMDIDTLISALHDIRSAGIAYENEESTAEICCAAVPLAENSQVKAAISVTIPKFRYTDEKKQQITQLLLQKRQLIEESCRIQNCRLAF